MKHIRRPMTRFDRDLPERAKGGGMGPPDKNVEVRCLHCDHVFFSDEMVYYQGFWCCPKISCGGSGFLFDVFPTASVFWKEDGEEVEIDEWGVMMVPCEEEGEQEGRGFPVPGN